MLPTEDSLLNCQRLLQEPFGRGVSALPEVIQRDVLETYGRIWMVISKRQLPDFQLSVVERRCFGILTPVTVNERQIIEACCRIRVIRAEDLFVDSQRPLEKQFRAGKLTPGSIKLAQAVETVGRV